MKIGIFSRTFETADLEETYKRMIEHGIYHAQFNLSNAGMPTLPESLDEERIEEIKKITDGYNIKLEALSGTFNMIDPDEDARKKGCAQFEIQCKIARMLDIPIVSLCTGTKNLENKWLWHDDNLKQSSWDDLLRSTEIILKHAQENNIILGVEPEIGNIINTPRRAREYLDKIGSPNIKIIMDGANIFLADQVANMKNVLKEAFDILGKDIVSAHAKDFYYDKDIEFVVAGQGILDFDYYLTLLKEVDYKGALIMHGLTKKEVFMSKMFLEEKIKNIKL